MIQWLFPAKCPVCGGVLLPREALVHTKCMKRLKFIKEPVCMRCGRPVEETAEYCVECETLISKQGKLIGWDSGRCVFPYHGAVKDALWNLKNKGTREAVRFFGTQMAECQKAYLDGLNPDCIVPVPLHLKKQRQRGFNQAELLAEVLAVQRGITLLPLLIKQKQTADQKSLSAEERKRNLRQAFEWNEALSLEGLPETVLLVDDVFTTGSTLTACASVLKQHGVQKVGFLCVCLSEGEE